MLTKLLTHQFKTFDGVIRLGASHRSFGRKLAVEVHVDAMDVLALFAGLLLPCCVNCIHHCNSRRLVF